MLPRVSFSSYMLVHMKRTNNATQLMAVLHTLHIHPLGRWPYAQTLNTFCLRQRSCNAVENQRLGWIFWYG